MGRRERDEADHGGHDGNPGANHEDVSEPASPSIHSDNDPIREIAPP
jgi:hypothetical protein